ncbi:MAG TPA: replication-relaxation family protein [Candidatus Bathyarchaeia archaeon]|nr:replication-relaxation family protein [Candidatus Bathyarchaeia archaeon]
MIKSPTHPEKRKRSPKLIPSKPKKNIRIGQREIAVLKSLAEYRFLTADQIRRLHFPKGSQSYCNERLRGLFHKPCCFVDRHPLPHEWGRGSPKLAYSLTKRGYKRLNEAGIGAWATDQSVYKLKTSTPLYKKHEIAVNEFRIACELAVEKNGWEIEEWVTEVEFKSPSLLKEMKVFDPEWGRNLPVAPDGFFSLYFPKEDKTTLFFLELDRGTMESARFRRKKIRGYHLFAEKWQEIKRFRKYKDLSIAFRVLTVVDGGLQRAWNLKTKCAEKEFESEERERKLAKSWIYYFTTLDEITPETVFTKPIWLIPYRSRTEKERFELIDFERGF